MLKLSGSLSTSAEYDADIGELQARVTAAVNAQAAAQSAVDSAHDDEQNAKNDLQNMQGVRILSRTVRVCTACESSRPSHGLSSDGNLDHF